MPSKIIRTVCLFSQSPHNSDIDKLSTIVHRLEEKGFLIQTKRLCSGTQQMSSVAAFDDGSLYLSIGSLTIDQIQDQLPYFYTSKNVAFNIDLTNDVIGENHVALLFNVIKNQPAHTFRFTYVFNNAHSSPYFPSATYRSNGFSIGLQPTDLSEGCKTLSEWLEKQKLVWQEIYELFSTDPLFIGIDSSVAPLFEGSSSLINFVKRLGLTFPASTTTDIYVQITKFIKENNPKAVGLCGLMFPCLEDFELAEEYENHEFSIERNIFLSLHSGLGIDTYPIGIDEKPERVIEILKLMQALSNKYRKPLSTRFVSDGIAKLGAKTDFKNEYLKDVVIKPL